MRLPVFLPDATRGVVRTLDSDDLRACGLEAVCVNAFHLSSRPGISVIESLGGIHKFMNWDGPILSDSGGFQLFSLPGASASRRGFRYRKKLLTPEKSIRMQLKLGADILVCLDYCTKDARKGVELTVAWAKECRAAFDRHRDRDAKLFAVVQGGNDAALRKECAERLLEIGFDGYGFGGWPVDEAGALVEAVHQVAELVPKPRWALGIGKPEHLRRALEYGYEIFDCVLPTRDARHRRLYTSDGYLYPLDEKHVRDESPVEPGCDCPCCRRCSRAYLHHLFAIGDSLAMRLATMHNLRFFTRLVRGSR